MFSPLSDRLAAVSLCLFLCIQAVYAQQPVGTSFVYQGHLKQSGVPVTGSHDFEFSLWDSTEGGDRLGDTVQVLGVSVSLGLFTVELDFGSSAFDGVARWLEIAVREAGTREFSTLAPRQQLGATPYALYALQSDWAGIVNRPDVLTTVAGVSSATGSVDIVGGGQHRHRHR